MAPSGTSSKPRKAGSAKAAGPRPIVPAIPLPYVKRQAAARAAASTAAPSEGASPNIEKVNGHVSSPETVETPEPAGALAELGTTASEPSLTGTEEVDVTPSTGATSLENCQTDDSASIFDFANTSSDSPSSSAPAAKSADEASMDSHTHTQADNSHTPDPTSASNESMRPANHDVMMTGAGTATFPAKEAKARPPAPISPVGYQMPPPFHPASRPPPGFAGNGDMSRVPRQSMPNGPPMHHSHPSNSSAVQFGAYAGSANSSPAPPHSGGIAPPPGMPLSDGRAPYIGPPGNGYPPIMSMGTDMVPVTHYDGYARPAMAYAPSEPFQPYGNAFGPSTPHSMHGSQSSGHPDDPSSHNLYHGGHSRNGPNGFNQDFQTHGAKDRMMMNPDFSRMAAHHGHRHHLSVQEDISEGLVDYLRQQFGNPQLSDSVVELHYSDNRAPPVRVPGHRLIFARSPVLDTIVRKQSPEQRVLILETDNKWVRSDAFYMSLQRLYGLPLLPVPPPMNMNSGDFAEAGSLDERFSFALAYAAAGKLLEWEPVLRRGCEIAAQLLDWQTIEKALEFALEGFLDHGTQESYKYEVGSKVLLHGVASFIVNNLPPTFSLDATVQESATYSRLPMDPGSKPKSSSEDPASIIVRGSQNPQGGKGHRHQLSTIQFGDLSLIEGGQGNASETPKASQQARPISHATLSRVLISVPFSFLQMFLEPQGPMMANGWASADARTRIVKEAIAEREARRDRAIEAVMDGRVRDIYPILQQLRAPEPRNLDRWGILGWQEEVLSHSNGDGPSLARQWAPMRDGHNVPVAEFP